VGNRFLVLALRAQHEAGHVNQHQVFGVCGQIFAAQLKRGFKLSSVVQTPNPAKARDDASP
jgi:hypothetical protein